MIKKRWLNGKPSRLGIQVTGQAMMMDWMNKDKKTAMQEVIYQQEEKDQKDDSGDASNDLIKFPEK
jgi:hypothetical protein